MRRQELLSRPAKLVGGHEINSLVCELVLKVQCRRIRNLGRQEHRELLSADLIVNPDFQWRRGAVDLAPVVESGPLSDFNMGLLVKNKRRKLVLADNQPLAALLHHLEVPVYNLQFVVDLLLR